jgi:hypothetical protein
MGPPWGVATADRVQIKLMIRNGSTDLVSDVEATVTSADGMSLGLPPMGWTDIGPGQDIDIDSSYPDNGRVRDPVRLRVRFTDSAGRRWERLGGDLRRIRKSEASLS